MALTTKSPKLNLVHCFDLPYICQMINLAFLLNVKQELKSWPGILTFFYGFGNKIASDYNETGMFCFSSRLNVLIKIGGLALS